MRTGTLALLAALVLSAPGCEIRFDSSHRSGPLNDDYVGEPLTDGVKQYEHALDVCNDFVRRLKKGEFEAIEADLCAPSLREALGTGKLAALDRDLVAHHGAMKTYKPLQWGFASRVEAGRKLLYSVKIVEYERGKIRFTFVFDDDGKYEKRIGIHWRTWTGPAAPGQL